MLFIFTAKMPELAVENVVVHPLVLLSVVDHFNRSVYFNLYVQTLQVLAVKVSRSVTMPPS